MSIKESSWGIRTAVEAPFAAGALLMLAGVVGASGAWATPADPIGGRTRENPLPKVAIVFSQMSPAGDGVHLRIGDPLGLMSRGLTARSPGVVDDHASRSPDGWLVLFERTTDHGSDIGIVHIAEPGVVTIVDTGCRTTPDCAGAVGPTWSFDGSRVLFTRVMAPIDESGVAASAALYSVKLDGSDLQRVSSPTLAQGTAGGRGEVLARRPDEGVPAGARASQASGVRDLQERRGRLPCAADDAVGTRRRPALHLTGPIGADGRTRGVRRVG